MAKRRGIPPVVRWRVTVTNHDGSGSIAHVDAINRQFARWNAESELGPLFWLRPSVAKVTIGRVKTAR